MSEVLNNPAAYIEHWLKQAEEYAERVRAEAGRGGRRPRTEPARIREVWCLMWGLDENDPQQHVECYRRGIALIETGLRVRRMAEESRNSLAPTAMKHFPEVERTLAAFMSPTGQIVQMMEHMQGTGWHSLELLAAMFKNESPDPVVDQERVADHLSSTRELIDDIAADTDLPSDLRRYMIDRLRDVESALLDATIKGVPALELAANSLLGASQRESDWWDRIAKTKWAPRVAGVWGALMLTLSGMGAVPVLMAGVSPEPAPIEQHGSMNEDDSSTEGGDVVDGELVDEPADDSDAD